MITPVVDAFKYLTQVRIFFGIVPHDFLCSSSFIFHDSEEILFICVVEVVYLKCSLLISTNILFIK